MASLTSLRRLLAVTIVVSTLLAPHAANAAEPSLGDAVTMPDGTVLPSMPPEQIVPTLASEQLAENGGLDPMAAAAGGEGAIAMEGAGVIAADELRVAAGGASGPGGPLPNGLRREVLGFLPYWELDSASIAALRFDLMSTVAFFSIGVEGDGTLARGTATAPTAGWRGWTSAAMTQVMNTAHAHGVKVVPTITLMSWNGDYAKLATLLNDPANRARLVSETVALVRGRNADGVNVDFEPVPSSLRSQFTTFIRELKAGLVGAGVGSYLTVDTMAGAAAWATGYDVVGLTAPGAADALLVMAYDFHYAGSARAGGVAPIESNTIYASADAMRDHLARVPGSKLIWGVPYYGRAWNTQTDQLNSAVRSPPQSVAFGYYFTDADGAQGGRALGARYGRRWDALGQVPWFAFWDANSNGVRQGYYEDPESLGIKYDHVIANGVAGIGIWALGMDTGVPDLWNVIRDRFVKHIARQFGPDRYATAAAVSAATFAPGVSTAFIATGANFPDALAAGPIATRARGPVLLSAGASLPAATAAELARLKPQSIVVLGGPAAVADGVVEQLRAYATTGVVTRYAGADRYGTAAAASAATFAPGAPIVFVATGANFPDALAGGVAASRHGAPILLVRHDAIPGPTDAELRRLRPARIVVLGSSGVVSDRVLTALRAYATTGTVDRIAGADRYATAAAISRVTTPANNDGTVYITTGTTFPDGLAGTPPAAVASAPLLTVPADRLPAVVVTELRRLNPSRVVILGGPGAVSDAMMNAIGAVWN
jgi:spore germination protein YaaH/putative cell wall-binding protein